MAAVEPKSESEHRCRVPQCAKPAVGYVQAAGMGRRDVRVGRVVQADQHPLCAEHLWAAGGLVSGY